MHAVNPIGENDPVAKQVLTVSEILRILAISGPDAKKDSRLDALTRGAAELRALVDTGAGAWRMREFALRGIAMAEESLRAQMEEALRSDAHRSRKVRVPVLSRLFRLGRRRSTSRAAPAPAPNEAAELRASCDRLLATLEGLRHDLAPSYPPTPEVQPTPQVAGASSPRQPKPHATMGPQLAGEEAR